MERDEALFEQVRGGDIASFDRLYERYEVRLFAYVRALVGDRRDAEEIFHDAFLKAFASPASAFDDGGFRAFIYRIARNLALNRVRSAKRRERATAAVPIAEQAPGADAAIAARELAMALERAVGRLPTPLSELYHLRSSGFSYEQIAGVVDAPIGTVKSRMHQMVQALREELQPWTAPK